MKRTSKEAQARIDETLEFAAARHLGQYRKGTNVPYIIHPLQVVQRMARWGVSREAHTDIWVAGLLHDVVEDAMVPLYDIKYFFGETVASLVGDLTYTCPEGASDEERHRSKHEYMSSFATKDVRSLVIKVSDRMCNVADFLIDDPDYAPTYWNKAHDLFRAMIDRTAEIEAAFTHEVAVGMLADYTSFKWNRDFHE